MGSKLEIKLYTTDEAKFIKITDESIKRAKEIDYLFSNYRDDSVLYQVNENAGNKTVKVPKEFIELTQLSIYYSKLTDGAFDITVGKLFNLWKSKGDQNELPSKQDIEQSLECIGYENIKIDEAKNEISFNVDCIKLDYGAIGKGYVVDEIMDIAKKNGVSKGLVNFGGNIYALSSPPNKKFWEVGIRKPGSDNEIISMVNLKNLGVATSGDYEKFFTIDGIRYSHILDPKTGLPVKDISSVTAVSKSATESDVYSTAISVLGFEKFLEMEKQKDLGILHISKDQDKLVIKMSEKYQKIELRK
ncbi:MAG: hypothetical protein GTO02_00660 [Candidatus Dadabacteria bacterium]|nr:hypothetical protein [Candidatus Dadabacteria bacterium]